jgi:uncharacterized metal-binding protein YceD (DUF177 family)
VKTEFSKIKGEKSFVLESDGVEATYSIKPKNRELLFCNQRLVGEIDTLCNRCGVELTVNVDEKSEFLISSGVYKGFDEQLDIIEAEDGIIDFSDILYGELQLLMSDYFYCSDCSNVEDSEVLNLD